MANSRSDLMANILATVKNDPHITGQPLRCMRCGIRPETTDAAGRLYVLGRFKAADRVYWIDARDSSGFAFTGMTSADLGFWMAGPWDQTDQVAVNATAFLSAYNLDALGGFVTLYGNQDLMAMPIWQVCGVAEPSSGTQYDLVLRSNSDPEPGVTLSEAVFAIYYSTGY